MADLTPYPMAALVRRMFRELERNEAIFDLPTRRFFRGREGRDYSASFHHHRPSSPLGPAAGPQTQMAQNIVLSWLGGSRVMELKTVQIDDELTIPRPCIDVHTVGLNIEWSQELKLEESLEEYVKGAMLVEMLRQGPLPPAAGFDRVVYDLSVGYDLEGIRSERVQAFVAGMQDAGESIARLRRQIPAEHSRLRGLDYPTRLADTVTLSTFHGCPPDEIQRITEFLLSGLGLNSIVKFNPMLLGPRRTRELLHDELGYTDFTVPDSAFARDTTWEQAVEIMERLAETAAAAGLGLGAKFSNTLIVENRRGFLATSEKEAYLSGQPLHVLAMRLVRRFRRRFGDRFPVSFAAGIERHNFADAAALGLTPITVCTDLLRKGGYGRLAGYYAELDRRMDAVGARSLDEWVLKAYGKAGEALDSLDLEPDDPRLAACREVLGAGGDLAAAAGPELWPHWLSAARLLNTEEYVGGLHLEPRYHRRQTWQPPRKIGRHLELFDCISCDICVPVCPNDANFTFALEPGRIPVERLRRDDGGWRLDRGEPLVLRERHQIGNFADFCNDCGNCDIFCPEDGGPYVIKPRFFGGEQGWRRSPELDGFYLERRTDGDRVLGRFEGREFALEVGVAGFRYSGEGFQLEFDPADPEATARGEAAAEVDLTYCHLMDYLRRALLDGEQVNYVNSLGEEAR